MELGKAIKVVRTVKKISLAQAGYKLGVIRTYVAAMESGKTTISRPMLEKISEQYQVPVWHIYWIAEESEKAIALDEWERKALLTAYPELEPYLRYAKASAIEAYEQMELELPR